MDIEELRRRIVEEASRCMYCGFCEAVCPTRPLGPHRGYGPRGRLLIAKRLAEGSLELTPAAVESIYTCLVCAACNTKCPAGIDIAGAIRAARAVMTRGTASGLEVKRALIRRAAPT